MNFLVQREFDARRGNHISPFSTLLMNFFRPSARNIVAVLFVVLTSSTPINAFAQQGRIIESIDVVESKNSSLISIQFNTTLLYVSHAPRSRSDLLGIQLRIGGTESERLDLLGLEDTLPWTATRNVPLNEVTFSNPDGRPTLNLRFNHVVEFDVQGGSDFRSITVTILHESLEEVAESKKEPVEPAVRAESFSSADLFAKPVEVTQGDKISAYMEEARQAMAKKNYDRAVQLYTKIQETADHPLAQDALEFLGLARERKKQLAHAARIYNQYLERYPEGDGAGRVRQRVRAMVTATQAPKQKLRAPKESPRSIALGKSRADGEEVSEIIYETFGGFSQFYRYTGLRIRNDGSFPIQSAIVTDLDITGRARTKELEFTSRFSGGYFGDLLEDGSEDTRRVSSLFFQVGDIEGDKRVRVGRQSYNSDGVLGRFDGGRGSYRVNDWLELNAVAGSPVTTSRDVKPEFDRVFWGVSADLGQFWDAWEFNAFYLEQSADGELDRRAVGGEVRFFEAGKSLFSFFDVDVDYGTLNTFIFLGSLTFESDTTVNLSLNYRNSPILTTTNSILGQPFRTLDQILNVISENRARELAEERTATTKTGTLGVRHRFNDHYQATADMTVSTFSGLPDSIVLPEDQVGIIPDFDLISIPGFDGTGIDFFWSGQIIGSSLFKTGDIAIIGFRFSDLSNSETATGTLNFRYPVTQQWSLNPRFRIDHRWNRNDTEQWALRPSFRSRYRFNRKTQLEIEAGADWVFREVIGGSRERTILMFGSIGYRRQF